jgi:hypothetical protein
LDIYTDTGIFLGENDLPSDIHRGHYLTSLSKNYYEHALWFDLNILMQRRMSYSTDFLDTTNWCNTGTVNDYRFVAKRNDGANSERFYCSGVLYAVNGGDKFLNTAPMDDYIFDVMNPFIIKPLSNRLTATHIIGQKQYFNFILKDELHTSDIPMTESSIGLLYRFYSLSGEFMGEAIMHEQNQRRFHIANTIEMSLDQQIERQEKAFGKKVGKVEVLLCCSEIEVSEAITFDIETGYSQQLNDFAFLNRLGGWESFNFGGTNTVESKTKHNTVYTTLVPHIGISGQWEKMQNLSNNEQLSVKTSPLNHYAMKWLRELGASPVVYELKTKRAIIIDELSLKCNSRDDLFQAEMKYHYSLCEK